MALYQSLTDRLRNQHEAIEHTIGSLDRERLFQPSAPGKWSIHDTIAHLVIIQLLFTGRVRAMIREEEPVFKSYVAEEDATFEAWRNRGTEELLAILHSDRQVLFHLITTLDEASLQRTGAHAKYGRLSILQWMEFFLLHEAHHMLTIFRLANSVG
jgi:uncharacterized damage-inducible protein DinB